MLYVGEKKPLNIEIKKNGNYVDPASITITIYINGSKTIENASLIKDDVGRYHYDVEINQEGKYDCFVEITDANGRKEIEKYSFYARRKEWN